MAEMRYETAAEQLRRIGHTDSVICMDCGVLVMNVAAHTRFHSILDAFMLATLPDPHPERRSPDYCWHSWPPRHTDKCGCKVTGTDAIHG